MHPGTGYLLWAGFGVTAIGCGVLSTMVLKLLSKRRHLYANLYWIGVSLYFIGVGCKGMLVGPAFVRYHLSDIGFTLFLGELVFAAVWRGFSRGNERLKEQFWAKTDLLYVRYWRKCLIFALVASYGYEVLSGWIVAIVRRRFPDLKDTLVGGFDWSDIAFYTLGAACGLALFAFWRRELQLIVHQHEIDEAEATLAAKRLQRAERRRTKPRKPRSRRKGRKG